MSVRSVARRWVTTSQGRWILVCTVLALFVGWAATLTADNQQDFALDSTKPAGAKALRLLLERYGVDTREGNTPIEGGRAFLWQDDLTDNERDAVTGWVERGGTLIVADFSSPLMSASLVGEQLSYEAPDRLHPNCSLEYVRGVDSVHAGSYHFPLEAEGGDVSCFPEADGFMLVDHAQGAGHVVNLADPYIFVNKFLDGDDNAVLAMQLLAPEGSPGLTFLQNRDAAGVSSGDEGLLDLIPDHVGDALLQLVVCGALLALWRSRRVGKPMEESLPVDIPSSQLIVARGSMMQNAQSVAAAAAMLRSGLRRDMRERLGLGPDVAPETLVDIVASQVNADRSVVDRAVLDQPVDNADELVTLSQTVEQVYREVTNVR